MSYFVNWTGPNAVSQWVQQEKERESILADREKQKLEKKVAGHIEAQYREDRQQEVRNLSAKLGSLLFWVPRNQWDESHDKLFKDLNRAISRFEKARLSDEH